ncbi:hypothetical protein GIHI108528_16490 [Gillisia hiemivivida]
MSCSNDDDDDDDNSPNFETAYAISVEAPSERIVGEKINIVVSFQVMNGCGEFGRFIESGNGLTRIIEIEAKYEGLICTMNLPIRQTTYEFTPNFSGEYTFTFKSGPDLRFGESGPDEFTTVTVIVTED